MTAEPTLLLLLLLGVGCPLTSQLLNAEPTVLQQNETHMNLLSLPEVKDGRANSTTMLEPEDQLCVSNNTGLVEKAQSCEPVLVSECVRDGSTVIQLRTAQRCGCKKITMWFHDCRQTETCAWLHIGTSNVLRDDTVEVSQTVGGRYQAHSWKCDKCSDCNTTVFYTDGWELDGVDLSSWNVIQKINQVGAEPAFQISILNQTDNNSVRTGNRFYFPHLVIRVYRWFKSSQGKQRWKYISQQIVDFEPDAGTGLVMFDEGLQLGQKYLINILPASTWSCIGADEKCRIVHTFIRLRSPDDSDQKDR